MANTIAHIRSLIRINQSRLQLLEEQTAREGIRVEPGILDEITSIKETLDQLEAQLAKLEAQQATSTSTPESRKLRVFLSYASEDKPQVREVYSKLLELGFDAWLDEEKLLPGQNWQLEIEQAVRQADVVLVFLTKRALTKTGYVQKEIKQALDVADKQPEGAIFVIPVNLEPCGVPARLSQVQWVDLYEKRGWDRLLSALNKRVAEVGEIRLVKVQKSHDESAFEQAPSSSRDSLTRKPGDNVESVPFEDRDLQLDRIIAEHAPAYFLLDAPAGYGKTALLTKLKRYAKGRDGWVCAYACADDHPTIHDLIVCLAQDLGLKDPLTGPTTAHLASGLATQLRRYRREEITRKGVMLLIDLGQASSISLALELANTFIPKVQNGLQVDDFFRQRQNRFRVVLAGRHLATQMSEQQGKVAIPFSIELLPPLRYEGLWTTTRSYVSNATTNEIVTEVAARIMYISGGHPGCIVRLLQMYKREGEPAPGDFFEDWGTEIESVIDEEIGEVLHGIPADLRPVIDILGIFRQVNLHILGYLIDMTLIRGHPDSVELADRLIRSYYFRRDGSLLRNDYHRVLGMRQRLDPKIGAVAFQSCRSYLQRAFVRKSEAWALEYLYQFLQSHTLDVSNAIKRKKLRNAFLRKEVPGILDLLVANRDQDEIVDIHAELKELLKTDQDFRFVVNYYTREERYEERSIETLMEVVDLFFHAKVKTGGQHA